MKNFSKSDQKYPIRRVILFSLLSLVMIAVAGLFFPLAKMALHLDLSQEYRRVEGIENIRFWDKWSEKVYSRAFWGLRLKGRCENMPSEELPEFSWLHTKIYDVSESGDIIAWYDWEEHAIFLGNAAGEVQKCFDVLYTGEKILFSPDEKYLLFYEIEYAAYGGGTTDDEYCYYRVIDIESGTQYTIYSGYREWYQVWWKEDD